MDNPMTLDMVKAAIMGDKEGFKAAFNATISDKVSDALEVKKVEVASSLLTPEVQSNEVEANQGEVVGSESSDGSAEATAETSAA
jgi:hypothetical protein